MHSGRKCFCVTYDNIGMCERFHNWDCNWSILNVSLRNAGEVQESEEFLDCCSKEKKFKESEEIYIRRYCYFLKFRFLCFLEWLCDLKRYKFDIITKLSLIYIYCFSENSDFRSSLAFRKKMCLCFLWQHRNVREISNFFNDISWSAMQFFRNACQVQESE